MGFCGDSVKDKLKATRYGLLREESLAADDRVE